MIRLHFRKDLLLDVWSGFFGVLALWWELSGAGEVAALAMLGAVLLHECGHLFCYWRTGIPVNRITFDFRGITIRPAQGIYPHKKQLATISGGCLFSTAGALAGWAASVWFGVPDVWWQASTAAAVYSLIPLPGTDGWEMIHLIRIAFFE